MFGNGIPLRHKWCFRSKLEIAGLICNYDAGFSYLALKFNMLRL